MAHKKTRIKRTARNNQKRIASALFVVLFACAGMVAIYVHAAGNGTLSITPASASYSTSGSFTINIYENSNTEDVNAAEADLTYPTAQLEYVSSSTSGTNWNQSLQNTGGGGKVSIVVGTTSKTLDGNQLIGTVTFKALAAGKVAVNFASTSVVLATATNTNEVGTMTGANYTITAPSSGGGSTGTTGGGGGSTGGGSTGGGGGSTVTSGGTSGGGSSGGGGSTGTTGGGSTGSSGGTSSGGSGGGSGDKTGVSVSGGGTVTGGGPDTGTGDSGTNTNGSGSTTVSGSGGGSTGSSTSGTSSTGSTNSGASGTNANVVKTDYYLNNKLVATVTKSPFTYSLNTKSLANGTYTFKTVSYYKSGATSTTSKQIKVKNSFMDQIGRILGDYGLPVLIIVIIIGVVLWLLKKRTRGNGFNQTGGLTTPLDESSLMGPPSAPIAPATTAADPSVTVDPNQQHYSLPQMIAMDQEAAREQANAATAQQTGAPFAATPTTPVESAPYTLPPAPAAFQQPKEPTQSQSSPESTSAESTPEAPAASSQPEPVASEQTPGEVVIYPNRAPDSK